jgi:hypothetical protein
MLARQRLDRGVHARLEHQFGRIMSMRVVWSAMGSTWLRTFIVRPRM